MLNRDLHIRYFKRCLEMLPAAMQSLDATRMMLVQLSLVGLAALGAIDEALTSNDRHGIIEWIYAQQVPANADNSNAKYRGFRGSSMFGPHDQIEYMPANCGNLAATYSALSALVLLGDSLERVDKKAIIGVMRELQQESGCFSPHPHTTERDPRFIYCACAVSEILGDWSGVDKQAAVAYIQSCMCYDGGLTQVPFQESHGGHVYCCVASLALMGRLDAIPTDRVLRWALYRQNDGYNGRVNKDPDACYAFWVGAAVEMLGGHELIDSDGTFGFLMTCQSKFGGVGKTPGDYPDPLHSALGLVGYSFCRPEQLQVMSPALLLPLPLMEARGIGASL
ncbi:protein geranylgeranyltransferas-like protein type I beta subunit [Linderina pennispora]|uniref:Protein geranylgeranyltransferas-like protein type I beta subunit n=1 Tax=Linderina pennispora TaxID=61395 RepID=A0A1Y1W4X3_9FUNG|nr:protein geranylgeranyltransferase-like protein type I beta subunit [Linderina pennispora]ORX68567.1 protein geranylgeranyltransferas-like protein type I beta subunit [Linderina pennispora]